VTSAATFGILTITAGNVLLTTLFLRYKLRQYFGGGRWREEILALLQELNRFINGNTNMVVHG
jgi:hypothetical protein